MSLCETGGQIVETQTRKKKGDVSESEGGMEGERGDVLTAFTEQ